MKRRILGILLTLLLAVQHGYSADKWLSLRSRNFHLIGNTNEGDLRRAGHQLEELRTAFTSLFPRIQQVSTTSTIVFVFKNDESFRPYKPLVDGKPANLSGLFQPANDLNYIAMTGSVSSQAAVLHDYLHSLMRDAVGTLPFWASEGLAEHYSTFELSGGKETDFTIGRAPARHIRTLGESFLPFDKLFAIDHTSSDYNEKTKQGIFYAESWALMHYLSLGADGKRQPQLLRFLNLLAQEKPLRESFAEAFQSDLAVLEKEVRDYIRLKALPALKVTAKNALVDKATTVSTLSEAEAQYHLGDLLLHVDRLAEAETHLKAALAHDPKVGGALASLGMVYMKKREYNDAVAYAKKAADTDTQNYLAHFYYSYLLQAITKAGEAVATTDEVSRYDSMRRHLHTTIDLAPNFVEAYGLLANINLDEADNLKEADVLLRKALTIAPGRHDLALTLAETMLRTDQASAARSLLATLGNVSTDPAVRSRALNMIEQLDLRDSFYKELTGGSQPTPPAQRPAAAAAAVAETKPPAPRPANRREPQLESLIPAAPEVEGEKITGLLINLDCANGLTMRIQVSNRVIELHSPRPDQIQFLSYTAAVSDSIKCGPRNPGAPVKITYRPVLGGTPASVGEPLVVEFLEK